MSEARWEYARQIALARSAALGAFLAQSRGSENWFRAQFGKPPLTDEEREERRVKHRRDCLRVARIEFRRALRVWDEYMHGIALEPTP